MHPDSTPIDYSISRHSSSFTSELIARGICMLIMAIFVGRIYNNYRAATDSGLIILLLSELFTFGLVFFARFPKQANRSLYSWLLVLVSIFYTVAINLNFQQTTALLPSTISVPFQIVGFIWQLSAKVWLGRSFGLLPEDKGLVMNGPYRLVRHPIYFGYLLSHIGFLFSHFSLWNVAVLAVLYFSQILRIAEEEKVLQLNPEYKDYMQETRFRLLPFVY